MKKFCIDAVAAKTFMTGEPRVFYRVWYGKKPPGMLRQILAIGALRPEYQSADYAACNRWIAEYHAAEAQAAAFNGSGRNLADATPNPSPPEPSP